MAALDLGTNSTDITATIPDEVSPRKLNLVGIRGIVKVFTEEGKVNRKTGEPLTEQRVMEIVKHSKFPKVWTYVGTRRAWREADVREFAKNWDQKDGPPFKELPPEWTPPRATTTAEWSA